MGAAVLRPKSAVPKLGWFAVLADPEMNAFAVWQGDPNAALRGTGTGPRSRGPVPFRYVGQLRQGSVPILACT